MFTREQVLEAFNRAADEAIEAIDAPEEGARDVANLVVNAGAHFLDHPGATLTEAIDASDYNVESPEEVLEWCRA